MFPKHFHSSVMGSVRPTRVQSSVLSARYCGLSGAEAAVCKAQLLDSDGFVMCNEIKVGEIYNVQSPPDDIRANVSRRMRWPGYVARRGAMDS